MSSGAAKRTPKFEVIAEYAPDYERMVRALLRVLGEPQGEIKHLLDDRRGGRAKTSAQTIDKAGDKTSKREECFRV
jgi:hypothetical protein